MHGAPLKGIQNILSSFESQFWSMKYLELVWLPIKYVQGIIDYYHGYFKRFWDNFIFWRHI